MSMDHNHVVNIPHNKNNNRLASKMNHNDNDRSSANLHDEHHNIRVRRNTFVRPMLSLWLFGNRPHIYTGENQGHILMDRKYRKMIKT